MSKERLEKIQQKDLIQVISDGFLFGTDGLRTENILSDVEWLIQQVERLEKENKRYREAIEVAIRNMTASDNLGVKFALGILERALEGDLE